VLLFPKKRTLCYLVTLWKHTLHYFFSLSHCFLIIMFNLDFSVLALWGGDHRPALYDWQTRTVWPKNIKITAETKTPTSWINFKFHQKLISKWTIPLSVSKHYCFLIQFCWKWFITRSFIQIQNSKCKAHQLHCLRYAAIIILKNDVTDYLKCFKFCQLIHMSLQTAYISNECCNCCILNHINGLIREYSLSACSV